MLVKFFASKRLKRSIILIVGAFVFLGITTRIAKSSQEIDMSQLTCGEFLEMNRMPQVMSIVWYNGFAAQERGTFVFTLDRDNLSAQKESLTTACEAGENELVVKQLSTIF